MSNEHRLQIVDYLDRIEEEALSVRVRKRPAFLIMPNEDPWLKTVHGEKVRLDATLLTHEFCLSYFTNSRAPMVAFYSSGDEITLHALNAIDKLHRDADDLVFEKDVGQSTTHT
jgi:hypothetical protein